MEIKEIQNKEEWEGFLAGCTEKTFLHSWQWGEFQGAMRGKIWRFGIYNNSILVSVCLVVRVKAKRGAFLLVPHGPVTKISNDQFLISKQISNANFQILQTLLQKLKELAKEEDAGFIRINPVWQRSKENTALFKNAGLRQSPMQMHPEASWKLDISKEENKLFGAMRKTTRYLIRQAEKNVDITIAQSKEARDVALFSQMHEATSLRQEFVPFSKEYLEKEFDVFSKDNAVVLFFGKYKGEIAAASFVVFWSGIAFYHHAARFKEYEKFHIPYLLQWEAIQEAKRRGCVLYDFWGYVNPETQPKHPWAGPTLFKQGFGGAPHEYVKSQDYVLSWKYWPTFLFEFMRRIKRGL